LPQDSKKAIELCTKAADLGSILAHRSLGECYYRGTVTTKDVKKAKHHFEIAAMKGDSSARHNLGAYEIEQRKDLQRAYRHFLIAAKDGFDDSMKAVTDGYKRGYVTKSELEDTLRAYQRSLDEMKSEQRYKAALLEAQRNKA
jgi:TPR repeat protein